MSVITKFGQPNIIFVSSIAFLQNVSLDSFVYIKNTAYINEPSIILSTTPYALAVETSIGNNLQIKLYKLNSMASE